MIVRCADLYDGRWCPCCGACTCRAEGRNAWAERGADVGCPLHGRGVAHGRVKVVTGKLELRSHRALRMGVQDRLRHPHVGDDSAPPG